MSVKLEAKVLMLSFLKFLAPPAVRKEKFALRWTYFAVEFLLRRLWVSPFRWDAKRKQLVAVGGWRQSRWTWLKWHVSTGFVILWALAAVFQSVRHLILRKEGDDELVLCFELITSMLSSIFVTLALHNFSTGGQFTALFNIWTGLQERIQREWMVTEEVDTLEDLFLATGIIVWGLSFFCVQLVFVLLFLVQCNLSAVGIAFPACHTSLLLLPFWATLQWWATAIVCQQLAVYVCHGFASVILGFCIMREIERPPLESRLKSKYQRPKETIRIYRLIYLIVRMVNQFWPTLLPVVCLHLSAAILGSSFYLIRGGFSIPFRLFLWLALCICLCVLIVLTAGLGEVSSKMLQVKNKTWTSGGSKYMQACYRACPPIKLYVGSFFVLMRETPWTLMYNMLDALVTLLCAIPK